jgi:hypothetical protein
LLSFDRVISNPRSVIPGFWAPPRGTADSKTYSESEGDDWTTLSLFTGPVGIALVPPAVARRQMAIFHHGRALSPPQDDVSTGLSNG